MTSKDRTLDPNAPRTLDFGSLARMPDSGPLARVHVLNNEFEAMVLHDVLANEGLVHTIESYRDTALDGLFQATRGWGAVITREEDVDEARALIKRALDELLAQADEPEG